jgi:RNA-binding protein
MLSEEQSNYLRILGHDLKPVCEVGAGGLTNSLLKTIDRALETEELVKIMVPFGSPQKRSRVLDELGPASRALVVQHTRTFALLYRPRTSSAPDRA